MVSQPTYHQQPEMFGMAQQWSWLRQVCKGPLDLLLLVLSAHYSSMNNQHMFQA